MAEQRAKHPLGWDYPVYLKCSCHAPHHGVLLEPVDDMPGSVEVSVISSRNGSIWHRIKWALKHVFGSQNLVTADVFLDPYAVARVRDFCGAVLTEDTDNG